MSVVVGCKGEINLNNKQRWQNECIYSGFSVDYNRCNDWIANITLARSVSINRTTWKSIYSINTTFE